jgi:hypothetical protein
MGNFRTLTLALLLLACDQGAHARDCPDGKAVPLPAPVQSVAAVPEAEPPFDSVARSDLKAHQAVSWQLEVSFESGLQGLPAGSDRPGANLRRWEVAETRAGDVPMPPGSTWKCRFDHVVVGTSVLLRAIRCSSDGWRTFSGDTASWQGPSAEPIVANVELFKDGRSAGEIQMVPCGPGTCLDSAPELP